MAMSHCKAYGEYVGHFLTKPVDHRWKLQAVVAESEVPRIAEHMITLETKLVAPLGLTQIHIHDIKHGTPSDEPELMRQKAVRKWKKNKGYKATYELLLEAVLKGEDTATAEEICKFLRDNKPEGDNKPEADGPGDLNPNQPPSNPPPSSNPPPQGMNQPPSYNPPPQGGYPPKNPGGPQEGGYPPQQPDYPQGASRPPGTATAAQYPVLDNELSQSTLNRMKWHKNGKEKSKYLKEEMSMNWKEMGQNVGISDAKLAGFQQANTNNTNHMNSVITEWKNRGSIKYPPTWAGLVKLLRDVGLNKLVKVIEEAAADGSSTLYNYE